MKTINLRGKVIVIDPCHIPEVDSSVSLEVFPGEWKVSVVRKKSAIWGDRVAELKLTHADYPVSRVLREYVGSISVDSGQAGVFDMEYYKDNYQDSEWDSEPKSWYRRVSDLTLQDPDWGTIDGLGANARSGYGDGCYSVFVKRNESGYIVGIKIKFI